MKTEYKQINFGAGESIESAVKKIIEHKIKGDLVCGEFNGEMIYPYDDLDSAYKKITGQTKSEFDEAERQRQAEYEREKRKHEEAIPRLTTEWVEKGKDILDDKHHELWAKIVPVRLGDLYRGMELGACLDIVEQLNNGCELGRAKEMIEEQEHSGMSFGLVCSMIEDFCDRGSEFVKYARA